MRRRWELSEDESRKLSIDTQRSAREVRRLLQLEESWVTLSISHSELSPEAISALLGMEPDDVTRKGDDLALGTRWELPSSLNIWSVTSLNKVKPGEPRVERHLRWMLDQIYGKKPSLKYIQETGGTSSLRLHSEIWSWVHGFELDHELLMSLAHYGLELHVIVHNQIHPELADESVR